MADSDDAVDRFFMDDASYMAYVNRQAAIWDYNSDMTAYTEKGLEAGRAEGIKAGRAEGENKLRSLIDALYKVGREDEVIKVISDKAFCEKLYKEFGID